MSFSNLDFVVVVSAANVVLFFFLVLTKMAVSDVSQKYDVIIRIFEILKYQNIPALTVWPIVPITFLVLNNHQSGRLAAKNSNSAEIAFFTFWSNVTFLMLVPWAVDKQLLWDVTVVDSLAPCRINAGSVCNPGTAAAEAAERKNDKYKDLVDDGYGFQQLAFEIQGAAGPSTIFF